MQSVQDHVDDLAGVLGRGVSVDDLDGGLVAYSAHTDADAARTLAILSRRVAAEIEEWQNSHGIAVARGPVRVPANAELGMTARVCFPLRFSGVLVGYLWIIEGPAPLGAADRRVAEAHATEIAALLHQDLAGAPTAGALLRSLAAGDVRVRAEARRSLAVRGPVRLAAILVGGLDGRPMTGADPGVGRRFGVVMGSVAGRAIAHFVSMPYALVLVAARAEESAAEMREAAAAALSVPVTAGVSGAMDSLDGSQAGRDQALAAAELAMLDPALPPTAVWERLGAYRQLMGLDLASAERPAVCEPLERLREHDRRGHLVTTLERYLDSGCDARATAERLHLHRTSLYYRLGRIEELTGRDLSAGPDRLELHLALKLARLADLTLVPSGGYS